MKQKITESAQREVSFAARVKQELCRAGTAHRSDVQAELYGVLLFCNTFSSEEVRIATRNPDFALRLPVLLRKGFHVEFDERQENAGGEGKALFILQDPYKLGLLFDAYGIDPQSLLAHHINFAVLEEESCRLAFFRGAFLTAGSVTDPQKRYHLELITSHYSVSREMQSLLQEGGFAPRVTTRKANYVTYFKQGEAIEDFLTAIGAPVAAMSVMNAQAEKHLRNGVNRRVNCEEANLDKVVDAAVNQVMAIRRLEAAGVLALQPEKLRETARLRRDNPEDSLSELAEKCVPPVSKSTVNHRLRRLLELAQTLPQQGEE